MAGTAPALIVVLLLCISDFSHSVADIGLSFVSVKVQGKSDTVLDLTLRNPDRLYHFAGDPANSRTQILPDLPGEHEDWGQKEWDLGRAQNDVISSFVVATESVARGISPFTIKRDPIYQGYWNDNSYFWNEVTTSYVHATGDETLTEMDLLIPLDCQSSQMTTIGLTTGYDIPQLGGTKLRTVARVPDCE